MIPKTVVFPMNGLDKEANLVQNTTIAANNPHKRPNQNKGTAK